MLEGSLHAWIVIAVFYMISGISALCACMHAWALCVCECVGGMYMLVSSNSFAEICKAHIVNHCHLPCALDKC